MKISFAAIAATAEAPTFWEELWQAIEKQYFSVDLGNYENIDINENSFLSLQLIIIGIFVGIVIASFFAIYDKRRLGGFVRAVIAMDCLSPDRAKTLDELGYLKSPGVRGSLKHGAVLSKVVHCVEREEHERDVAQMREKYIEKHGSDKGFREIPFDLDLNTAHFYIPDEEHYRAEIRFDKKGTGWRTILLVIVLSIVGTALVIFLLPEMLQMADNMIGIFKGDANADYGNAYGRNLMQ